MVDEVVIETEESDTEHAKAKDAKKEVVCIYLGSVPMQCLSSLKRLLLEI